MSDFNSFQPIPQAERIAGLRRAAYALSSKYPCQKCGSTAGVYPFLADIQPEELIKENSVMSECRGCGALVCLTFPHAFTTDEQSDVIRRTFDIDEGLLA